MNLLLDNKIGAEQLQFAAYKALAAEVNTYIATEQTNGATIDSDLFSINGRVSGTVSLEQFAVASIHYGHRPSMIEAPIDEYPSMSVSAYLATPSPVNALVDYGQSLAIRLAIEFIVKSGPYKLEDRTGIGEDIVGRRSKRTAEAIHRLMDDHRGLAGFNPPDVGPNVAWGEIFEREELGETVTGSRFYWQGVRLEYLYNKQTVFNIDQTG